MGIRSKIKEVLRICVQHSNLRGLAGACYSNVKITGMNHKAMLSGSSMLRHSAIAVIMQINLSIAIKVRIGIDVRDDNRPAD